MNKTDGTQIKIQNEKAEIVKQNKFLGLMISDS